VAISSERKVIAEPKPEVPKPGVPAPEVLTPDLCVVGAGAAGLSVAAVGAALGASVVLVERGMMGGDCLNVGCVPSKALLAAAHAVQSQRLSGPFGVVAGEPVVDFAAVKRHVRSVIAAIAPNDSVQRFTAMGVRVLKESAAFTDNRTLSAGAVTIKARRFVIAAGSRPAIPAIEGLADLPYLTNESIFDVERLPERLIIIGGGPIGMELAQAFVRLGSQVVVLETAIVLSREDAEMTAVVRGTLQREGVRLIEGVTLRRCARKQQGITVAITVNGEESDVDGSHILVATGREPSTEGLGLDKAGIASGPQGIVVNKALRTANGRVYAIGDVAQGPNFTHVANYQAGLVVRHALFGLGVRAIYQDIPRVTYTDPEIATVGLDEKEARARGWRVEILRWPFAENDRAQAERATEGLIKVVADRKGRILGASIVGRHAGELITPWTLALARKLTVRDMASLVVPYPTLSEVSRRAAISYFAPRLQNRWLRMALRLRRWLG
jgi:pyruvate/2-oxoglutarate dehydrogenase complex dihydrolipoamide dehydrogenase (E3) component